MDEALLSVIRDLAASVETLSNEVAQLRFEISTTDITELTYSIQDLKTTLESLAE